MLRGCAIALPRAAVSCYYAISSGSDQAEIRAEGFQPIALMQSTRRADGSVVRVTTFPGSAASHGVVVKCDPIRSIRVTLEARSVLELTLPEGDQAPPQRRQ